MGFEDLKPIFGQPKAECSDSNSTPLPQFLFYVHALNPTSLRFLVTDFHTSTWESIQSLQQLEDMRDNIGVGGSWSEFVDYVMASLKSEDVKLALEGQSKSDGAANAKLIAQKSKGMPRISVFLTKLVGIAASESIANFSLELYKSFNGMHKLLINEQERCCQLTKVISAEQEKNENIQRQLDAILYSKKQKSQKMNDNATSDSLLSTAMQDSPGKQSSQNMGSTKVANRVVPAYRRVKVRGVLLQDTEDDANN
ncbi:hypothetical protein LguiA_003434 [Lonicera macranthoides]